MLCFCIFCFLFKTIQILNSDTMSLKPFCLLVLECAIYLFIPILVYLESFAMEVFLYSSVV